MKSLRQFQFATLDTLLQLLKLRKDKRYRAGLLQAAVSFGVISNSEYTELKRKYVEKARESSRTICSI